MSPFATWQGTPGNANSLLKESTVANRIFQAPQINLAPNHQQPFFVDMEAFFEFSFWMAEELTDLVANYEDQNPSAPRRCDSIQLESK